MARRKSNRPSWAKKSSSSYRSRLEADFAVLLDDLHIGFVYEPVKIPYVVPAKKRHYTPDFVLDPESKRRLRNEDITSLDDLKGKIIIETKGYLDLSDRNKMLYVKAGNPSLDIRFVFPRDGYITSKGRKSKRGQKYSEWCEEHGFLYHIGVKVPKKWLTSASPLVGKNASK